MACLHMAAKRRHRIGDAGSVALSRRSRPFAGEERLSLAAACRVPRALATVGLATVGLAEGFCSARRSHTPERRFPGLRRPN